MKTETIKKRQIRFISIMLSFLMFLTQSEPILAEEIYIAESAGESIAVSEEEEKAELDQAIIDMIKEADDDQIPSDMATELTVTYKLEKDVTVREDADAKIAEAGTEGISYDGTGQVVQKGPSDSETQIAPLVYQKEGYVTDPVRTWKTEHYEITGYTGGEISGGEVIVPPSPTYGYITYYFPYNATLKEVARYASNGSVELTPAWVVPNIVYDEESLKEADNPNKDKVYCSKKEVIELLPITEDVPGHTFAGWDYSFKNEDVQHSVAGTEDKEGLYLIDTGNHTTVLTAYAVWEPVHYNITYIGIEVEPESEAGDTSSLGTIEVNGVDMAVLSEQELNPADIMATAALPTYYIAQATTVLPGPDEINKGEMIPSFTEYNRFLSWSCSRRLNKQVRTLGLNGDITHGDVTLYAIYTARYPIPYATGNSLQAKEFKAVQNTVPNLFNRDEYAVISLVGTRTSADSKTAVLPDEVAKYFELCEVDARKAELGHGYATIGIRLKDDVDADTAISLPGKIKKFTLKVQGTDHEVDDHGEPVYKDVIVTFKTKYKAPKYKLTGNKATLYTNMLTKNGDGSVNPAQFNVSEKQGQFLNEIYTGVWEADYVVKSGKTYSPVDPSEVSVSIDNGTGIITVSATKGVKGGFIRLRNTSWLNGAYVYLSYTIKENAKERKLSFSRRVIILNNGYDGETETVRVIYDKGMIPDSSKITINTEKLPSGISASYKDGEVTVTGAKDVKAGSYKLSVSSEGVKKAAQLKIKVMNTPADKAVKMKVRGKFDAFMGGSIYLSPIIKGYSGTLQSVKVLPDSNSKSVEFDELWDGSIIELYTNSAYVPGTAKKEIKLELTLSTGRVLPCTIMCKRDKGKVSIDTYDVVINLQKNEAAVDNTKEDITTGSEEVTDTEVLQAVTPVIITYIYSYYSDPDNKVTKIYTSDLSRDIGRANVLIEEKQPLLSKQGGYSGTYKDGIITIKDENNYLAKLQKETEYTLKLNGVWKVTGQKLTTSFNLKVKP